MEPHLTQNLPYSSIKTPLFMDKSSKTGHLSIKTPLFMDGTMNSGPLSTKVPLFVDNRPLGMVASP